MTAQKGIDPEIIWQKYLAGITQKRIADDLGIARNTVVYHLRQIRSKKKGGNPDRCTAPTSSTPEGESDAVLNSIIADSSSNVTPKSA